MKCRWNSPSPRYKIPKTQSLRGFSQITFQLRLFNEMKLHRLTEIPPTFVASNGTMQRNFLFDQLLNSTVGEKSPDELPHATTAWLTAASPSMRQTHAVIT